MFNVTGQELQLLFMPNIRMRTKCDLCCFNHGGVVVVVVVVWVCVYFEMFSNTVSK